MAYGWLSRLFGILDLAWWAIITAAVTLFCVVFIRNLIQQFTPLFITVAVFCGCYLSLMSTIGLLKATTENLEERGPESRIRLCKCWLYSSWISFGLWALYFTHYIFQPWRWGNIDVIFGAQFVVRGLALFCIHKYILELKAVIRARAITEAMIPLATGSAMTGTNEVTLMSVYSTGRQEKMDDCEDLPNYEELMRKEMETNYCDNSPPAYETVIGATTR